MLFNKIKNKISSFSSFSLISNKFHSFPKIITKTISIEKLLWKREVEEGIEKGEISVINFGLEEEGRRKNISNYLFVGDFYEDLLEDIRKSPRSIYLVILELENLIFKLII